MPNDAAAAADDGIDANVIVAIDIADADAACAQCDRPNCAGGDAHQANAVYLGCRRCGLELNDVRPLFFRPAAERSSTTCELCGLRYRTGHYVRLHFLSHFNELTSATRPLLCVQCAEDAEAAERQVRVVGPVPLTSSTFSSPRCDLPTSPHSPLTKNLFTHQCVFPIRYTATIKDRRRRRTNAS